MRILLLSIIAIALVNATTDSSTCPIRSLLKTNQFMIVGSRACSQVVETGLTDGTCPKHFQHPWTNNDKCKMSGVRAHLVRDIHGKTPPSILYIGKIWAQSIKSTVAFAYNDAIGVPIKMNSTYFTMPEIQQGVLNKALLDDQHTAAIKYVIFDTRSFFLYVIKPNAQLSVYLVDSELGAKTKYPHLLSTAGADGTKDRENYVADPYTHEVYYTVRRQGVNQLFKLPIDWLLRSFYNGFEGEYVTSFNDSRLLLSVSDGILVSRLKVNDSVTTLLRDLKVNGTDECMCDHKSLSGMETNLIILRDWDYCMIRYGMDREYCEFEKNELAKAENLNVTIEDDFDYEFLAILLLLGLLVIVLLACLYASARIHHYRRKYEETEEKAQFLQEQMATALPYPTNMCYNSDMDVTVDRYN